MHFLPWNNVEKEVDAKYIVMGVKDESGSRSMRKGAKLGPDSIRKAAYEMDMVIRHGAYSVFEIEKRKVKRESIDIGNLEKERVEKKVRQIVSSGRLPIVLGGDHSITSKVLKGIGSVKGKISLIYLDAHPDMISSSSNYYGSVVYDSLEYIDPKRSIIVGVRAPEDEELENMKKTRLKAVFWHEFEKGIDHVIRRIKSTIKGEAYLSIDLDCLDPSFAPGVSTPSPGGMTSRELLYIIRNISRKCIGMDVMEMNPNYDINGSTAHIAARCVMEFISSGGSLET
ncbi:MAG: arginase family protein [Candidatus Micrarchaeaceae archaeon]